jgi:DNA-binding NtrC family response regulator
MPLNIVLIDDEIELCEIYKDLLETDGLIINTYSSLVVADKFISNNKVDLCFIDFRMPEMNGPDFRKKIPSTIPCFLLTGELFEKNIDGFIEILEKPLNTDYFYEIISRYK